MTWRCESPRREKEERIRRSELWWADSTIIDWNMVILRTCYLSSAAADRAVKHGCHSQTVGSGCLDRKVS